MTDGKFQMDGEKGKNGNVTNKEFSLLPGKSGEPSRRTFIRSSLAAGAGLFFGGQAFPKSEFQDKSDPRDQAKQGLMVKVLGTAQDGGFPQMACSCQNCQRARKNPAISRKVVCLGLLNFTEGKSYMIEATPDAARQVDMIRAVDSIFMKTEGNPIDALLLTHADIGHYTGLVQFRPEVTLVRRMPVHCTESVASFLTANEPWKLMVLRHIIELQRFSFGQSISLDNNVRFEAVKVPHDKYSDMSGYKIFGPRKSLLFIPDIDAWEERFLDIVSAADYAFVDGTFYADRKGSKIHPLIKDSMVFLKKIAEGGKTKIFFIHFNHNNEVLSEDASVRRIIEATGFTVADEGLEIWL